MKPSSSLALGLGLALVTLARGGWAGDAPEDDGPADYAPEPEPPPDPALRYLSPAPTTPARAVVEELLVLGVGFAQYAANREANEADFDLGYDWPSLRSKLTFESVAFDNNRFPTNWLTHPLAGYFYYTAARSNRLGLATSYALSFAASALWETVGELREQVAINDLLVTPTAGLAVGESTFQLGALLHRAAPSPAATALGWLFAPLKAAHDAFDGVRPMRAEEVDDLGLPADVWHRFEVGAFTGITKQQHGLTQADFGFWTESRIVTLPGYGRPGRRSGFFDSGEVTGLRVGATFSHGEVVDLAIESHVVAAGGFWQDVRTTPHGLAGSGFAAGLRVGAEYGTHDYDRDGRRGDDRVALVGAGPALEESLYLGPLTVRARFDALASFAGVDAYALPEYQAAHDLEGLPSVVRNYGYYHAYGATLRPAVELFAYALDAGLDLRADWFEAFTSYDRKPDPSATDLVTPRDRRIVGRAWLAVTPLRHLRLALTAERRERDGEVGVERASRGELAVAARASLVF